MKPVVLAIFAHPDDEAFGPGGTLALLANSHDIHIVTVTGGEAGKCSIDHPNEDLHHVRMRELADSAKILGVTEVDFFGYKDGTLSNDLYLGLAEKILRKLNELEPEVIITFDKLGVSGHIDHITVSLATTFALSKTKLNSELWYFCIPDEEQKIMSDDYFIFFPDGHKKSDVDKVIDVSTVWDKKVGAIQAHSSQKHDGDRILEILESLPKEEYFFVHKPK